MNKKLLYLSLLMNIVIASSYALHHQLNSSQDIQACDMQQKKPVRIYVDMIGDLFHAGHVAFLQKAREVGADRSDVQFSDVQLIVGLCSDEVATNYKRKPILNLDERTQAVQGCKYVDEVVPDCPLVLTEDFIKEHAIDVVIHGDDYTPEQVEKFYNIPQKMGIYKTVPYTKGVSTTDIIRRIKERPDLGATHPFQQKQG